MIPKFLHQSLQPIKQSGKETIFRRRTPDQSNLMTQSFNSLSQIYDFIRMLDAPDYPKAFMQIDGYTITFENAQHNNNNIEGIFKVTKNE